MRQRIFCVPCGAHAFDYEGDIRVHGFKTARVKMADGSVPVPYQDVVIPCGHKISRPEMDLRIEELAEPDERLA